MGLIPVVSSAWIRSDLNIKADKCMASSFDKHVTHNSDLHCPTLCLSLSPFTITEIHRKPENRV